MYIVSLYNDGKETPIHDSTQKLTSGKIVKGINAIDSFTFTILPSNAGFNEIYDYVTKVFVYNTNRNRYEFFGRVLYSDDEMSESGAISKEVVCESYFGFLCDSQQEYVEERNWTVGGLLEHIINTHNSQLEGYKQFTIGEVTVTDPNDNIYCGIQRKNTWDTIKEKLIDKLGGEIQLRVEGSILYLDYLVEIGETSSTEIRLSKNMKAITREKDPSEIITRLIPLGCKLKSLDEEGKEEETEYRLDITPVNDGKNYIDDELAISIYGIRVGTVEFDDVTVASTLMTKGEDWLEENNKIQIGYKITALDLSLIGLDADEFEVYNYYPIINPLLGINNKIRVIKKTIDIVDEVKSTMEFGDAFETLSESMKRQSDALGLITSNYVTNKRFTNTINKTTSLINQTAEEIRLEVTAQYSDLSKSYSQLKLDYDSIEAKVVKLEDDMEVSSSEISISFEEIKLEVKKKVNESELGTKIVQNYESVQIAWNQCSEYVVFENGAINIYTSATHSEDTLLSSFTHTGNWYYNEGAAVGKIGTVKDADTDTRGLAFTLEPDGGFMTWAYCENEEDDTYIPIMTFQGGSYFRTGLVFQYDTYCNNHLLIDDFTSIGVFDTGSEETPSLVGFVSTYHDVIIGAPTKIRLDANALVNGELVVKTDVIATTVWADTIEANTVNQSDARLKTNIETTSVDALDMISQIEMKQFDWIESGEHCDLGMIAQQLQAVEPSLVHEDSETGCLAIKVNGFIPYLIKAVQELSDKCGKSETKKRKNAAWIDTYSAEDKAELIGKKSAKRKKSVPEMNNVKKAEPQKMQLSQNAAKGGNKNG